MSTNPLHHTNVEKEIYEISSMASTDDGFKICFKFGPYQTSENANSEKLVEFAEVIFQGPVRVDYYSDEGFNQSFNDAEHFEKVDEGIPGLIVADGSTYLNEYKNKEEWAAICHEDGFRHFIVWSYGSGVIHVLSDIDPLVKKVSNAH